MFLENKQNKRNDRLTVKELPTCERPDEKCVKYGPSALSDAELLAAVIRTGSADERSVELACRVLNLKPNMGINSLYHLDIQSLLNLKGIGTVKAVQIMCVAELSRRMAKAEYAYRLDFTNSSTVADYYMEDMRHLEMEVTMAVFLDTRMTLVGDRIIHKGTVNSSMFSPREILSEALRAGAVNLVVLHNHPSGDPTPSYADISSTQRLKSACDYVGLNLRDHIVIGDNRYVSFVERGLI